MTTLEAAIEAVELALLTALEPLTAKNADLIKSNQKSEGQDNDATNTIVIDFKSWEVLEESPSEDEYEFTYLLKVQVRDPDVVKQKANLIDFVSESVRLLYLDRTLNGTVIDVKTLSGEINTSADNVPEETGGYASGMASVNVTVRHLITTPT